MTEFQYKTRKEQKAMTMEELAQYRCAQRKYEYKKGVPLKGITIRKFLHPIVEGALKVDRLLSHEKLTALNKEKRPTMYVCTHIGGNDVLRIAEALNRPGYIFFGDPGPLYKDPFGNILAIINGTIDLELDDKEDRHISFERAIELLLKGGEIIIFPEGSWNPFANLPVMKTYEGAAKLGIATSANIVPLAIEQYGNEYIFNKGEIIRTHRDMDAKMLNRLIRDTLATLRYEIWESQPKLVLPSTNKPMVWEGTSISEKVLLQRQYDEIYMQTIIDRKPEYGTLQDVYNAMFIDPNETSSDILIAGIQDRLALIRELKLRLQKTDDSIRKLSDMIVSFKDMNMNSHEKEIEYGTISSIIAEIEKENEKTREIIEYLKNDDKSRELEEEYDFDSATQKRITDLNRRINIFKKEKDLFILLANQYGLVTQSESNYRISFSNK